MKWLMVAACAALISPSPADACTCLKSVVAVSPPSNIPAPLNTLIRVSWRVGMTSMADATDTSISLVRRGQQPAVVVDRRLLTSGRFSTLILTPRKPLIAESVYMVVLAHKSGSSDVLGTVVTGTALDKDPPTWKGTGKVQYFDASAESSCSTDKPWATIEIAEGASAVKDDFTERDSITFAIWPADGKLDASRLLAIIPAQRGTLTIGYPTSCSPQTFDLPATAKSLKFRIAPIDDAGNAGEPSMVTIDMTTP